MSVSSYDKLLTEPKILSVSSGAPLKHIKVKVTTNDPCIPIPHYILTDVMTKFNTFKDVGMESA